MSHSLIRWSTGKRNEGGIGNLVYKKKLIRHKRQVRYMVLDRMLGWTSQLSTAFLRQPREI